MNQEFIDKNYEIRLLKEGKVKVHGKELMVNLINFSIKF